MSDHVHRCTTLIEAPRLSKQLGLDIILVSETFQYTGSFKFRAAYNVASKVQQDLIITASSGNFGQALAYACSLLHKSCIVVMPTTSATVKVTAVRDFGGQVDLVDLRQKSRAQRVAELLRQHPMAYGASAYDDPLVIEGNSSLGFELAALVSPSGVVVAPVGGGGLISGILTGLEKAGREIEVFGAEPLLANDAALSLRAGKIIANVSEPQTIADGARTVSLGKHPWEIIRRRLGVIVETAEAEIAKAVRMLFDLANVKAEPTGGLGLAAILTLPQLFRNRRVYCIVSGGNVDPAIYAGLIAA